ncbi:type II CAAX endopeptidase family protein [Acaryochloris marina]|uniref:type II CAAX endopeptidase family protein n=1 Tax=Acaryochloris marina TaxID=155978 RepID=UPI0021C3339A|nr:type II CAAX endopeptidase family protein [Acaryochloris marina]
MDINSAGSPRYPVPLIALAPFLLITFGLAWGILALYILLPGPMTAILGQLSGHHPLFILAVWSPAISAIIVIIRYVGLSGLRRYLSRMFLWHCPSAWYAFLLFVPLLFYAGAAVKGNLFTAPFPFTSLPALLSAIAITLILGPVEEFGWRGLALPLLQRRFAPIWAGLILGGIWGIWHLPAFLLSGTPQSAWSFTPFLLGSVALSLIVTPLFNASQGSILLSYLFHFQLINPIWPDAQPYDIFFFWVAAFAIVVINRKTMFRKAKAVTEVIPPAAKRGLTEDLTRETHP